MSEKQLLFHDFDDLHAILTSLFKRIKLSFFYSLLSSLLSYFLFVHLLTITNLMSLQEGEVAASVGEMKALIGRLSLRL